MLGLEHVKFVLYPESIILKDTCLINLTVVIICLCKNTMLYNLNLQSLSVQSSRSVVSDSL